MIAEPSPPPPPQTRPEDASGPMRRAHHVVLIAFAGVLLSYAVGGGLYNRVLPRLRAESRRECSDVCGFVDASDGRIFDGRCVCSNGETPLEKCDKR